MGGFVGTVPAWCLSAAESFLVWWWLASPSIRHRVCLTDFLALLWLCQITSCFLVVRAIPFLSPLFSLSTCFPLLSHLPSSHSYSPSRRASSRALPSTFVRICRQSLRGSVPNGSFAALDRLPDSSRFTSAQCLLAIASSMYVIMSLCNRVFLFRYSARLVSMIRKKILLRA
ncbi:hypothetical protein V1508DRAFT_181716 [Lipomyces doorenjongii]|uniref:uncharacterized protein n=1 Tax=Lipomyces doorenjongii TaxID=383834 RepID=UPI0034CE4C9E